MNYISQEHRHLLPEYKESIAYTNIRILAAATVFLLILSIPYIFEPVPEYHPNPLFLEVLAIISILLYLPQFVPLWPRFPKDLFQPAYTALLFVQITLSIPLFAVLPFYGDIFAVSLFLAVLNLFVFWDEKWNQIALVILFVGMAITPAAIGQSYGLEELGYLIAFGVLCFVAVYLHRRIITFRWNQYLQRHQISQLNHELQLRTAELDAFTRTVAHDLKTPFNGIVGYAELLHETLLDKDIELDAEIEGFLQNIKDLGYSGFRIVDELLLLSATRKEDVPAESIAMQEIIDIAVERLRHEVRASKATLTFPETYPPAVGYAPWLVEVWVNYISNAIKYGGSPPQVEFGYTAAENNNTVRFWIKDNGQGLTTKQKELLFLEFSRLADLNIATKGHGLGLSIVRRIIEKLDGDVGVDSEVGRGSTFFFTLPIAQSPNGT